MAKTFVFYINGKEVDDKDIGIYGDAIIGLAPKSEVILRPFNFDDKETATSKQEPKWYHNNGYYLNFIKLEIARSWNYTTREIYHIYLRRT